MVEEQQRLGRYELLAEIGRGAMGVVYKARDPIIDRVLAIKTVDFRGLGAVQTGVQARFFQEAQSAGRLSHPNIVTIFDAGEAEGCAYIAMELLEGPSLREVLDQSAPLSVTRALEIAGQIARGLAYAHEHGVVHRDVKPANVILVARRVKITDFGIAVRRFQCAERTGRLAQVHVTRAGAGRKRRWSFGSVCARHGVVRNAHRQAAFPRRKRAADHAGGAVA